MGEPLYALARSTWTNMRYNEYNKGIIAAIDYLTSLKRDDLQPQIDELRQMLVEIDTTRSLEILD